MQTRDFNKKKTNYSKFFFRMVNLTAIRTVLGLVVKEDLHLKQLDVKTTFFMMV